MPIAAIAVAALLALSHRPWRPVGVALGLPLLLDLIVPALELPSRHDLALWLAAPAVSAWCAWVVLGASRRRAELCVLVYVVAGLVLLYGPVEPLRALWPALPLAGRLASIAAQVAAARSFWGSRRPGGSTETAALGLLAGDVLSLLGPAGLLPDAPWWVATAQAGVVGSWIVLLQIRRDP